MCIFSDFSLISNPGLDFSYKSNNWGVGLPPKEKNEKNWPLCNVVMWNLKRKSMKRLASSPIEWRNTRVRKLMRRLASSRLYFFHKRTFPKFLVVITFMYGSNFETQMECSIKLQCYTI
ncbi:hypothetical protein ACSBR1_024827 [Camellia fascicularis]